MGERRGERILEAVDRLAPAFEASGLDEMELAVGDLAVRLARPQARATVDDAAPRPTAEPPELTAPGPPPDAGAGDDGPGPGRHHVAAPLTGVWYSAPSPGARPYVTEGSEVTTGQVIGLIEAMKLFNEIKADASGTITRVLADSGTLVKRKQPLLEIETN